MLKNRKDIGLCLSGGGLRAIAHIGVLKALEELQITPVAISGTSAGAIIGCLFAHGYKATELMEIVAKETFFSRKSFKLQTSGIFKTSLLSDIYSKYLPENDFSALKIPMTIAATDIGLGQEVFFSAGELYGPLLATASIPFIFPPTVINDRIYCDGGLLNNLPIEPLQQQDYYIIASHVNAVSPIDQAACKKLSPRSMAERLFYLGMANHVNQKKKDCNSFIEPANLVQYSMFDKKNAPLFFNLGYEAAMNALRP
ncbi:MAG: patatin-like phospholipase family protein [Taibaiella sp.]|nr:patatin-like phospholipase family protein [Taibaiella sp.]